MSAPLLEAKGLRFSFGERSVLEGVDIEVRRGEIVALLGPNGGGKTTLLRCLAGILRRPSGGEVRVLGKAVSDISRRALARVVAVVGQELSEARGFRVREVVAMGRHPHVARLRVPGEADRRAVARAIEATDLMRFEERKIDELSGGERQRVALARALAQEPQALLLDEPTAHLDLKHKAALFAILREVHAERGVGTLLVTHELGLAAEHASRAVLLRGGRILCDGEPISVLRPDRLREAFDTPVDVIENPRTGAPHPYPTAGLDSERPGA